LKDEEPLVRAAAAAALGKMGSDARAALPALNELQKDQATVVRLAVAEAINKITSPGTSPR
jgi:HEAT repeat protein